MSGLRQRRIAVAADRSAESIATLIENFGGEPVAYPIQGRQRLNDQTSSDNVLDFLSGTYDWVILTTGIGARTLSHSAQQDGIHASFIDKLKQERLAIRGKKTVDWLKENDLSPEVLSKDGTMEDLMKELADGATGGKVFLQAYSLDDAKWKSTLEAMGYEVHLSHPYSFEMPSKDILQPLKDEIARQSIDAVVFTSKTQVKNLFANKADHTHLVRSFNDNVLAVAVGKVTAKELEAHGIDEVIQPSTQKMGAMVVTMDHHFKQLAESN